MSRLFKLIIVVLGSVVLRPGGVIVAQPACPPPLTGDVDGLHGVTPGDALLALQAYLGKTVLSECSQAQANVLAPSTSGITPADALCIFRSFLGLDSCLTTHLLSGVVSKGPVRGATITLWQLHPDGTPGEQVVASTVTNARGVWSVRLSAAQSGPFLVMATGGEYLDEDTGTLIPLGDTQMLGLVPPGVFMVAITPLTHALALAVQDILHSATGVTPDVTGIVHAVTANAMRTFGFDPVSTTVADPRDLTGSSVPQVQYAAIMGALSRLLETQRQATGSTTAMLLTTLYEDLMDGEIAGPGSLESLAQEFARNPPTMSGLDVEGFQQIAASIQITPPSGGSFVPFILDVSSLDNASQLLQ